MKNVMMAAVNSAFKYTREREGEIFDAAGDLRRGATDVPGRGWERRKLMVYFRLRKNDEAQNQMLRRHTRS